MKGFYYNGDGSFQMFSNGKKIVLILGERSYIVENPTIKDVIINYSEPSPPLGASGQIYRIGNQSTMVVDMSFLSSLIEECKTSSLGINKDFLRAVNQMMEKTSNIPLTKINAKRISRKFNFGP